MPYAAFSARLPRMLLRCCLMPYAIVLLLLHADMLIRFDAIFAIEPSVAAATISRHAADFASLMLSRM